MLIVAVVLVVCCIVACCGFCCLVTTPVVLKAVGGFSTPKMASKPPPPFAFREVSPHPAGTATTVPLVEMRHARSQTVSVMAVEEEPATIVEPGAEIISELNKRADECFALEYSQLASIEQKMQDLKADYKAIEPALK